MPAPVRTTRMRRRLAIAFALTAGISAGALAAGSYLLVRDARLDDSAARAREQTIANLRLASTDLTDSELLESLSARGSFCTVLEPDAGGPTRSCLTPGLEQVPASIRTLVADNRLAQQRITVGGRHLIVAGGRPAGRNAALYAFYDEQQVWDDIDELGRVLLAGWLVLVVVALVVGSLLARRILAPVARASEAANSLAEGLLDTRLPVQGRDEFAAWAAAFNEMAEALAGTIAELKAAQQRERRFTANVAHELRTPLTALLGEASLLVDQAASMPENAQELAALLAADLDRLRRLVEDLLEISRLDAGEETAQFETVDVRRLVEAVLGQRGWSDRVDVEGRPAEVTTDPRRLERVVANLVANAIEHGRPPVTVRLSHAASALDLVVADDGPGIDPDHLEHLFEPFYKAQGSRGGGTGLGLAIARENARLLGGTLQAGAAEAGGTEFRLHLPVTEPLHDRNEPVAQTPQDGDDPTFPQGGAP